LETTAQIQASKIGGLVREALTIVSNPDPPPVFVPEAKTRIFGLVFFIPQSPFWVNYLGAASWPLLDLTSNLPIHNLL
jgi:hypothetical protein